MRALIFLLKSLGVLLSLNLSSAFPLQASDSCELQLAKLSDADRALVDLYLPYLQESLWRKFLREAEPELVLSEAWVERLNRSLDEAIRLAELENSESSRDLFFRFFSSDPFSNPETENYRDWARGTRFDAAYEIAKEAARRYKTLNHRQLHRHFDKRAKELKRLLDSIHSD